MKKAFLISGFNMNTSACDAKYDDLKQAIASKGYEVVPVPFHWNRKTVAQYCEKFIKFYYKNKGEHNIVIGNSYGAMVAFIAAPVLHPEKVFACSLSPYFAEDLNKTTEEYRIKRFGKRRNKAQHELSANQIASEINKTNVQIVLLYGEKEKVQYPHLVKRVHESAFSLNKCQLIEIPNAPHTFRDQAYIEGIKGAV